MGIELPKGDAPPEQSNVEKENNTESKSDTTAIAGNTQKSLFLGVIVLLLLAAILMGVLPDWKEKRSDDNGTVSSKNYLESNSGPFDVKIPLFSPKITKGYSSNQELEEDLKDLAKFILNGPISTNRDAGKYSSGSDTGMSAPVTAPAAPNAESTLDGASTAESSAQTTLDTVDAFNTNTQELSVNRADFFVKSDGNFLFAAYGDFLVVWTINGQGIISKI